jgi:O-antigen ligase
LAQIISLFTPLYGLNLTTYLIAYSYYLLLYISWDNIKDILRAYVVSSTISALLGLMGYIGLLPSLLMYDRYRVMALFKDPNVFGPFLVPAVILLIEDIWRKKIFCRTAWIRIVLIVINLFGIILSFSRGAWLNMGVCLLVYLALNIKKIHLRGSDLKKIVYYGFLIMIVIYTIWSTIIPYEYREYLLSRINFQTYDRDRFETQIKGIAMASINIFGYGPGQFEYYVLRYTGSVFSAHNLYIKLAMENGIIGLLLFLGLLAIIMYELARHHLQKRTYIVITPASLIAIFTGILINSIVIDTIHWRHLWFFIGLSMANIMMSQIDAPDIVSDDLRSVKQVPGISPTYR